jgi:hypothetical protein
LVEFLNISPPRYKPYQISIWIRKFRKVYKIFRQERWFYAPPMDLRFKDPLINGYYFLLVLSSLL